MRSRAVSELAPQLFYYHRVIICQTCEYSSPVATYQPHHGIFHTAAGILAISPFTKNKSRTSYRCSAFSFLLFKKNLPEYFRYRRMRKDNLFQFVEGHLLFDSHGRFDLRIAHLHQRRSESARICRGSLLSETYDLWRLQPGYRFRSRKPDER